MELPCAHLSWFRRGRLFRIHVACFALADLDFVAGLYRLVPVEVFGTALAVLCAIPVALLFLLPHFERRDRGPAGTLHLDAATVAQFTCGWLVRGAEPALELQTPSGDLRVARTDDTELAARWLAASGLDARPLAMRLDDGAAHWLINPLVMSISLTGLAAALISLAVADPLVIPLALVVMFASQVALLRVYAYGDITVGPDGVCIRRFAHRTLRYAWSELRAVDHDRHDRENEPFILTLAHGERVRLRSKLVYGRHKVLLAALQRGLA